MRISDWSADVCSSDLGGLGCADAPSRCGSRNGPTGPACDRLSPAVDRPAAGGQAPTATEQSCHHPKRRTGHAARLRRGPMGPAEDHALRSEEHTSELQSLMRISYAVFCLKKKK